MTIVVEIVADSNCTQQHAELDLTKKESSIIALL